jgi:hypothetical protein
MFEPVKVVFHDVCDGKTLKFWDMYYRYYFLDGLEPDMNAPKQNANPNGSSYSIEQFLNNITPAINPNLANLPASLISSFTGQNSVTSTTTPNNTVGTKQVNQDVVTNQLNNWNFGFNLPQVQNIRNLIQKIDIYQVHAGHYNQVTLVNPRISAFNHDTLDYAAGGKTLELTFTFEYEYAYYTIQNMQLGGTQINNNSTIDQYTHGQYLELPALQFAATLNNFIESNNPLLTSNNPILAGIGQNVQQSISGVTTAFAGNVVRTVSASALNGLANISPTPYHPQGAPIISTRPFANNAVGNPTQYVDVNRIGNHISG